MVTQGHVKHPSTVTIINDKATDKSKILCKSHWNLKIYTHKKLKPYLIDGKYVFFFFELLSNSFINFR